MLTYSSYRYLPYRYSYTGIYYCESPRRARRPAAPPRIRGRLWRGKGTVYQYLLYEYSYPYIYPYWRFVLVLILVYCLVHIHTVLPRGVLYYYYGYAGSAPRLCFLLF